MPKPVLLLLAVHALLAVYTPFHAALHAQTPPGNYTGHTRDGRSVVVSADTLRLRLTFYAPDVVRVDYLPSPAAAPESSLVVIRDTAAAVLPAIAETDSALVLSSPQMTVRCRKYPLRLGFEDAAGLLLVAEPRAGGLASNFEERSASFQIRPEERFCGTGERGTPINLRGQAFGTRNTQIGGYSTPLATMNLNVPFIASSAGYAVYFENTYPGRFDVGSTDPSVLSYLASGGELSYFLIAAPDVPAQLERYTWLTGRQPLPPRWAFGFIQSRFGYGSEAEAREVVRTMRQKRIPCDAVVLDLYWFDKMGDISWKASAWPDPFGMMRDLKGLGIRTVVITEPYIVQPSVNFAEAASRGFLARNSGGTPYLLGSWWSCGCNAGLLDITNREAADWWWSKHPGFFGKELAGIWTDLGEPERHDAGMVHAMGSAARVHNIYNLLWAETIFRGFNAFRPNERLFNLTRSGYAGIQRYGAIPWSGDVSRSFGGLAVQVPMVQSMGMSGLAYHNSDIGGFTGGQGSPELYVRWMQYGTFCPITRAHGTGRGTEPWTYGQTAEDISRKYIELRYRLLPYIYTLAYQNYRTGMPLVRPLFFLDPAMSGASDSYLWGDAFLVAPVVAAGQTRRDVPLPQGTWYDFWTGRPARGPGRVTVAAPVETLPLFVRGGSIIPMQALMQYTDERPLDTLFLEAYPPVDGPGLFVLYEDDGKTLAYQSGGFAETDFASSLQGSGANAHLEFTIAPRRGSYGAMPEDRTYLVAMRGIGGKPGSVTLNGEPLAPRPTYDSLRSGGEGYWYDASSSALHAQIPGRVDSLSRLLVEAVQITGVAADLHAPRRYALDQNYPNPFNPVTTIRYELPVRSRVSLKVFNTLGQEVATLVEGELEAGYHQALFDASRLASGLYFFRLEAGSWVQARKLAVIR